MAASKMPKVIIIGGGIAGLVSARHLQDVAEVTVFEGRSNVGGLWSALDPNCAIDNESQGNLFQQQYGCHFRNIFDDLIMNIPTMFAQFKDCPHADGKPSFLTREGFRDYVNAYVEMFGLRKYVQLNTFVLEVRRLDQVQGNENKKFAVVYCESANPGQQKTAHADYVIVANGHNQVPYMPDLPGSDSFTGNIIHSRDYRHPDDPLFKQKTVLLLGAGYSGLEMVVQFLAHPKIGETDVKKIYFCGNVTTGLKMQSTTDFKAWIENGKLELIEGRIERIEKDTVFITNGEKLQVDTIIACTGYQFAFPFLKKSQELITVSHNDSYFSPLYKMTFCIKEPNLCFVGNIDHTCFIQKLTEYQACAVRSLVKGDLKLPGKDEMLKHLDGQLLDFPGDMRRKFFNPICASKDDNKIIDDFVESVPSFAKDKALVEGLNNVGRILVAIILNGDYITYRATDASKVFPDFEWDTTKE